MSPTPSPSTPTQTADSTARKGGRKRKRAKQIALGVRRMIPGAFIAFDGDVEKVAAHYGVQKIDVVSETLLSLLRGPNRETRAGLPLVMRRTA